MLFDRERPKEIEHLLELYKDHPNGVEAYPDANGDWIIAIGGVRLDPALRISPPVSQQPGADIGGGLPQSMDGGIPI